MPREVRVTVLAAGVSLPDVLAREALHHGMVMVSAYTDPNCTTSAPPAIRRSIPNVNPRDQNQPPGSPGFFAGNCKFITRKLWGSSASYADLSSFPGRAFEKCSPVTASGAAK